MKTGRFEACLLLCLVLSAPVQAEELKCPSGSPQASLGLLVPAYFYPVRPPGYFSREGSSDPGYWQRLERAASKLKGKLIAIANVHNGPGEGPNEDYRRAIRSLRSKGARVIGYVRTDWGRWPAGMVKADMRDWHSWYSMDGIFFDEATDGAGSYYRRRFEELKEIRPRGALAAFNPGTLVSMESFAFEGGPIVCLFENQEGEESFFRSLGSSGNGRACFLKYGVSREDWKELADRAAAQGLGWIYLTDDGGLNPWDSLPPYFEEMAGYLSRCYP